MPSEQRNANRCRHKRLNEIGCERRLLLSGTPIQNNTEELFAILHFLLPDIFKLDLFEVSDNARASLHCQSALWQGRGVVHKRDAVHVRAWRC
eukprot:COSAG01_NODE_2608_length_7388_cov_2.860200_8_plen_93_part_00